MQTFDEQLARLLDQAFCEDLGDGDHSTLSCIPAGARGRAVLKVKEAGILAGVAIAEKIFRHRAHNFAFTPHMADGDPMQPGQEAFVIEAGVHTILQCERIVLNCMQRMSGIATLTRTYADKLQGYRTRLLDTRKTTPNFRLLEKEAVRIGGGVNHRFGLFDMIMLKDNHIDFCGGLEKAIIRAWSYVQETGKDLRIEVETRTLDDVQTVVRVGQGKVFRIMLDNFTPDQIRIALDMMDGSFESEASGGIRLDNMESYAATGVDYISAGALIHQARSLDLSLKAVIL